KKRYTFVINSFALRLRLICSQWGMRQNTTMAIALGALVFAACGDDDDDPTPMPQTQRFTITIENISGESALPTPFAPGVALTHTAANPLFTAGMPDRGEGLEALAEDGAAGPLAASIGASAIVFNTPMGATSPGPLLPGGRYQFSFDVPEDTSARMSLATMLVQSNDWFVAPDGTGIALFDASGEPIEGDITSQFSLWDSGTEADEIPGSGLAQAPRQGAANEGRAEGRIGRLVMATRALPAAHRVVDVTVTESGGVYSVTVANVSEARGDLITPIAPVAWAIHDDTFTLFDEGSPDRGEGLEVLAEDGSPAVLAASLAGASGVGSAGAQPITMERPSDPAGPAMPGERFVFDVTPSADHPYLSFAAMVVASNDAFVAPPGTGIRLIDMNGNARPAADVQADIMATLAVWDAGTEANEVPGVGPNQPAQQAAADTGDADPDNTVRRYLDTVNDLAGAGAGGFATVTVTATTGGFMVEVSNSSGGSAFPGILTPVAWAIHEGSDPLFMRGGEAAAGLARLADDGGPADLVAEMAADSRVANAAAEAMVVGSGPGPLMPGASYQFMVSPTATERYLSLFSMIVPSNDTFLALTPVALLDEAGAPRTETDIAADITAALAAWDAGTEGNQVGAGGRDQAPRGDMDTGPAEAAVVRSVDAGAVIALDRLIRVTVDVQ
ncbi:MAG: spondin domain-containing protein, partial [Myxococcota bacterium]